MIDIVQPQILERLKHEAMSFAEDNYMQEPQDLERYARFIYQLTKTKIDQHLEALEYWITNMATGVRKPKTLNIFFFKDVFAEYVQYTKEIKPLEQRKALPQRSSSELYFKRTAEEAYRDTYLYLWMDYGDYKKADRRQPINPSLYERFSDQLVNRSMILPNEFTPDEIEDAQRWSKNYCAEFDAKDVGLLNIWNKDKKEPKNRDHIKIGLVYLHFKKRWKAGERPHETLQENIECYEKDLHK